MLLPFDPHSKSAALPCHCSGDDQRTPCIQTTGRHAFGKQEPTSVPTPCRSCQSHQLHQDINICGAQHDILYCSVAQSLNLGCFILNWVQTGHVLDVAHHGSPHELKTTCYVPLLALYQGHGECLVCINCQHHGITTWHLLDPASANAQLLLVTWSLHFRCQHATLLAALIHDRQHLLIQSTMHTSGLHTNHTNHMS